MPNCSPDFDSVEDITLIRKAIRSRWPIKDTTREKIVNNLEHILDSPDADPTLKLRAGKQIADLDKLNIEDEKLEILRTPKKHLHLVSQMSPEELEAKIQELKVTLGQPEAMIRAQIAHEINKENNGNQPGSIDASGIT